MTIATTELGRFGSAIAQSSKVKSIADSPVGQAAWILDHDACSYALIARIFDGQSEGLMRKEFRNDK